MCCIQIHYSLPCFSHWHLLFHPDIYFFGFPQRGDCERKVCWILFIHYFILAYYNPLTFLHTFSCFYTCRLFPSNPPPLLASLKYSNTVLPPYTCLFITQVSRLRNAMEVKDGLIDEGASKTSTLERDIKRLNKEVEQLRGSDSR